MGGQEEGEAPIDLEDSLSQEELCDTDYQESEDEVLDLLQAIHPEGDRWSICAFGPDGHSHLIFRDHLHALDYADRLNEPSNVYTVSWGLASLREGIFGRGTSSDVEHIRTVWVDIDIKDHDGLRYPKMALSNLAHFVEIGDIPPPSATVFTGGGAHAYWILDEAVSGDDLQLIPLINQALAERVEGDYVGDLARVLRIPGTHNKKYEDSPLCHIHELRLDRRYSLVEMLEFLEIDRDQTSDEELINGEDIDFNHKVPKEWEDLLKKRKDIRKKWKKHLSEGERSEMAMSIALYAVHAGIVYPDEIATILHLSPALGDWAQDKPSALGHTITKALRAVGKAPIKLEMYGKDEGEDTVSYIVGDLDPSSEGE